jgi:RNA 3'-terminal phosphate cyclase (ATP)
LIAIDGSLGEGGGQVLRTALGLALVTGQAFRIVNIRAGRKRPGLLAQHLAAVRAAAQVSGAAATGAAIGSRELAFEPGDVRPGAYEFAVGTAGSATLVLQTVLPALAVACGPSQLLLKGGTHNPWAPPYDFLAKALLPLLGRMGPTMMAELRRPGFYPAGGGEFRVLVRPAPRFGPLELMERGEVLARRARALVARLPEHIARRELQGVRDGLGWSPDCLAVEKCEDSPGPGNVLILEVQSRHVTEVFAGFGRRGVRAEEVAAAVVEEARRYLAAGVPVGEHMADQLLVPLALGGGRFRTVAPTRHTQTNIAVIQQFMDVQVRCEEIAPDVWEIGVETP